MCMGKDHIDINLGLDKEVMYRSSQESIVSNIDRRTLTSGGGEALKGGIRIFTDSKTTIWNNSRLNSFTKPTDSLALSTTYPALSTLCGYGGKSTIKLTTKTNK